MRNSYILADTPVFQIEDRIDKPYPTDTLNFHSQFSHRTLQIHQVHVVFL